MRLTLFLRDKIDADLIKYIESAAGNDRSDFIRDLMRDGIKYKSEPVKEVTKLKIIIL